MPASGNQSVFQSRSVWIFIAVIVSATLSRWLSPGQSISLIWAPAGFIFAFTWKYGARALIPSAAALLLWGALAYPSRPWVGVAAAVAEIACSLVTVWVLRWVLARQVPVPGHALASSMRYLHWLLRFYLAALGAGATVAALIGATGFTLAGLHTSVSFVEIWIAYWIIQALGLLLFAPLTLAWLGAGPHDANPLPYPPRRADVSALRAAWEGLDTLSVALVLALTGVVLLLRASNHTSFVSPLSLAYIPAAALCAMRRSALVTYLTLAVSGLLLCTALSLDANALSFGGAGGVPTRISVTVFETIALVFVSTLLAQLLQAVSSDRAEAMLRLQEQSTRDLPTGLSNELGFSQWLAGRDLTQSWLIVGVAFGTGQRLAALLGPVRLITIRQLIADRMTSFAATHTARPDAARYLLAFPDTEGSLARIAELARAFNSFASQDDHGNAISLHGVTRVLRLQPNEPANALLLVSTLAMLTDQRQRVDTSAHSVHAFSAELQGALQRQMQRNEHIRGWIQNNAIELFAQVIHPSGGSAVAGQVELEVLCRLRDDAGGLLAPADFFEVANQAGLAVQLDRQIITNVFDWFKQHPDALAVTRKCAINLASATLSDPDFLGFIEQLLRDYPHQSNRFCFEITESNAIDDVEQSRSNVQALRANGFRVSIDDFGTGFATYSYLKRYQVDEIKIDGTFVTALGDNAIDSEIVQSIVRVAHMLKVKTVAEFVATDELRARVERLGVDYVQGFAIGIPQPIALLYLKPAQVVSQHVPRDDHHA